MAETESSHLKFAIMCNSLILQQWQFEIVESLIKSGKAEPVLVIQNDKSNQQRFGFLRKIISYPWSKLLFRKYYQYLFRPDSFKSRDAGLLFKNLPVIIYRVDRKKRFSEYFREADVEEIRGSGADFIIKFGFGIIRGKILDCTPYGIWSFHHGDEQKYRGVPPAFNEIMRNDRITGAVLQRLTETLDGGIILRKGYFPTINHSWKANLDQAIRLSVNWPLDVCREILSQHTFPSENVSSISTAPIYKAPGNYTFFIFLCKQAINKVRFHFIELFSTEKWQTGLLKARAAEIVSDYIYRIDTENVVWLGTKGNERYFADGFALKEGNRLQLFFEDYSYKTRKAVISSAWFNERDSVFSEPQKVLEEPWHLSYPFIYKADGQLWCVPESIHHGDVELYRFDINAGRLLHHRKLIKGLAATDPTLLFHQNHWYLFFTPAHATNIELHIWHADTLEGPFLPHEMNPVKADISNSRPAGPFFTLDGKLYRPAQDCSHTYGGRIVINEVKLLTDSEFLEMPVSYLKPPDGFTGIHTLSFAGDFMYFDCKKPVFSVASFIWQMKRRLRLVKPNQN